VKTADYVAYQERRFRGSFTIYTNTMVSQLTRPTAGRKKELNYKEPGGFA